MNECIKRHLLSLNRYPPPFILMYYLQRYVKFYKTIFTHTAIPMMPSTWPGAGNLFKLRLCPLKIDPIDPMTLHYQGLNVIIKTAVILIETEHD